MPRSWLTIPGRVVDLGIEASRVLEVTPAQGWSDIPPLDLSARLCWERAPSHDEAATRVLVVKSLHGELPVLAHGKLTLREAPAEAVMPIPPEFASHGCGSALAAVLFEPEPRPLLVLAPEGLWQLFQAGVS